MKVSISPAIWIALELEPSEGSEYARNKAAMTRHFADSLGQAVEVLAPSFRLHTATYEDPEPDVAELVFRQLEGVNIPSFRYIRISGNFDGEIPSAYAREIDDPPDWWWKVCACDYLADVVDFAVQLSDISHPGAVTCGGGTIKVGPNRHASVSRKQFLFELHHQRRQPGQWPNLKQLDSSEVARWAVRLGATHSHIARTRIQRTLAAYTQLVSLAFSGHNEKLFRAMQGLEAFYCDGMGDFRHQLREKTTIWLGPRNDGGKLNAVGVLYDIRSKFVHGSAALDYWRKLRSQDEPYLATLGESQAALEFASELLVATLQRCVEHDVIELDWKFDALVTTGQ